MTTSALITLDADYEAMRDIGPWLTEQLGEIGGAHLVDRVGEFELAIHELAVNIVDHAYDDDSRPTATLDIAIRCDQGDLVVTFTDRGQPYDDGDKPVIGDEPTVRGYGLFIVEQLAKSVEYERRDPANVWTLVFAA
ncbi:MAG: ATP-binding protein [Actinomycetota bacterium]